MEAVAGEVARLRQAFAGSMAWGINPRKGLQVSWQRGIGFPPRLHLGFRAAAWLAQRFFHINHLFGSLGDWFHLKAVASRPAVMTVAEYSPPCDVRLLSKVDAFVVEWPAGQDDLLRLGIERNRLRMILPPVDLDRFPIAAGPTQVPFTVLFASSPDRADWLEARGVTLLLEAAALRPAMRFRLLWRPWGNSVPVIQDLIKERGLPNVELRVGRVARMAEMYQQAHVTIAPFRSLDRCKPAPNSVVESLACGRPVVVTRCVGLAELIEHEAAGLVCEPLGESIVAALDRLQTEWDLFSEHARRTAEKWFREDKFLQAYAELYAELLGDRRRTLCGCSNRVQAQH